MINGKIMLHIWENINKKHYKLKTTINEVLNMAEKNMIIALVLSFLWSGLGLIYAGDMKRGIILAVLALIAEILYFKVSQILGIVVFIIWIYSMYATYKEVKAVNGE